MVGQADDPKYDKTREDYTPQAQRYDGLWAMLDQNRHVPELVALQQVLCARYRVVARFTYRGHGGTWIWVGGRVLLQRPSKYSDFVAARDVQVVGGNLSRTQGGSNGYPALADHGDKNRWVDLAFNCLGLPKLDNRFGGWGMHILSLAKRDDYER